MERLSIENLLRFLEYGEELRVKKTAGMGTDDPDLNITLEKEMGSILYKRSVIVEVTALSMTKSHQSFKPIVKRIRKEIVNEYNKDRKEKNNI